MKKKKEEKSTKIQQLDKNNLSRVEIQHQKPYETFLSHNLISHHVGYDQSACIYEKKSIMGVFTVASAKVVDVWKDV